MSNGFLRERQSCFVSFLDFGVQFLDSADGDSPGSKLNEELWRADASSFGNGAATAGKGKGLPVTTGRDRAPPNDH